MKLIAKNIFKINGVEYRIKHVTWISISKGIRESYTFVSCNWDKPIVEYTMDAKSFESKVGVDQYLSLT